MTPETVADPYNVRFRGGRLDPYRVAVLYGITHPALQQALKKLLRLGQKHKTEDEDAQEVITSMQRFLEMRQEDLL